MHRTLIEYEHLSCYLPGYNENNVLQLSRSSVKSCTVTLDNFDLIPALRPSIKKSVDPLDENVVKSLLLRYFS